MRPFRIVGGLDADRDSDSAARAEARKRARPILRHWLRLVGQHVAAGALLPGDYLLAHAMTNYPSANFGRCWAGQDRLAATVGRSTRTVIRSRNRLCAAGLLAGRRGKPGRTAVWTFCEAGAPLFGGNGAREKKPLKKREKVSADVTRMSHLDVTPVSPKPFELYHPIEQEPPPYPPAPAQAEPPQGSRDGETLAGSAPLTGEVLGPEALITFNEFWRSIRGAPGKLGPAIAAWRGLTDDDRRAIRARIGPLGLSTDGMWACTWLRERRWECEPLHDPAACFDVPAASRCIELAPYSADWISERDRRRAAGERVTLMEDLARAGRGWTVRCQ